jgi:hypothetical protein
MSNDRRKVKIVDITKQQLDSAQRPHNIGPQVRTADPGICVGAANIIPIPHVIAQPPKAAPLTPSEQVRIHNLGQQSAQVKRRVVQLGPTSQPIPSAHEATEAQSFGAKFVDSAYVRQRLDEKTKKNVNINATARDCPDAPAIKNIMTDDEILQYRAILAKSYKCLEKSITIEKHNPYVTYWLTRANDTKKLIYTVNYTGQAPQSAVLENLPRVK